MKTIIAIFVLCIVAVNATFHRQFYSKKENLINKSIDIITQYEKDVADLEKKFSQFKNDAEKQVTIIETAVDKLFKRNTACKPSLKDEKKNICSTKVENFPPNMADTKRQAESLLNDYKDCSWKGIFHRFLCFKDWKKKADIYLLNKEAETIMQNFRKQKADMINKSQTCNINSVYSAISILNAYNSEC